MKFLIILLTVFAVFVATPVFAQGIGTDDLGSTWAKLSASERAEMAALIAKKAEAKDAAPFVKVEEVEPWLTLIDHLGTGLVKLAHNLGVEANELLNSPVGFVTVGLVAYHVMGDELMGIFAGLLFFSLAMPVWLLFFFKSVIPIVEFREVVLARSFGRDPVNVNVPIRRQPTWAGSGCGPEVIATFGIVFLFLITVLFIA